ncbi:MAG: PcsB-like coiled-coil domain-containing protein, partial [Candidatus Dormibacteraceae bacterium]
MVASLAIGMTSWFGSAAAEGCDNRAASLCQKIQQGQAQASQQQSQLNQIKSQIQDANAKDLVLSQLVKQIQGQVETQKSSIQQTQTGIKDIERSIRFTSADLTRGEAHIAVRDQLLGQRLRVLSKQDNTDYLAIVLTAQSFSQLIDRVSLMRNVIKSDEQMVSGLTQDQQQITNSQNQLNDQRYQLDGLLRQQRQQQQSLEQELGLQQQALQTQKQLEDQLAGQRQEMENEVAQVSGNIAAWQQQYQ